MSGSSNSTSSKESIASAAHDQHRRAKWFERLSLYITRFRRAISGLVHSKSATVGIAIILVLKVRRLALPSSYYGYL